MLLKNFLLKFVPVVQDLYLDSGWIIAGVLTRECNKKTRQTSSACTDQIIARQIAKPALLFLSLSLSLSHRHCASFLAARGKKKI